MRLLRIHLQAAWEGWLRDRLHISLSLETSIKSMLGVQAAEMLLSCSSLGTEYVRIMVRGWVGSNLLTLTGFDQLKTFEPVRRH